MKNKKRWEVLIEFIKKYKFKIGAEIGVWDGRTTLKILNSINWMEKCYCIDPWKKYEAYQNDKKNDKMSESVYEDFKKKASKFGKKIEILRMFSSEAAKYIPDESLDYVFIDANHNYEFVKEDINLYLPKVKKGCLIGGHDYKKKFQGVVNAVDEIFGDNIIEKENATWWAWKE